MGADSSSATTSSSTPSPSGKRSRDPEDEVYVDKLHSHKRYLSEIMASSLNGLTVGDPLPEYLLESPARSEGMYYPRDEMSWQYSPMSEDSDYSRFSETPMNTCFSHSDSRPTSPVSPYRYQRQLNALCSTPSTSSYPLSGNISAVTCSQHRKRGSDTEGRIPSSPSDICHSSDLRRTALMRSVQMKTQPAGPSLELQFGPGQENLPSIEVEEQPCSFVKSDGEYQIEECSSLGISEPEFTREKSCKVSNMDLKGVESGLDASRNDS